MEEAEAERRWRRMKIRIFRIAKAILLGQRIAIGKTLLLYALSSTNQCDVCCRDAVSRCGTCADEPLCGYCPSTLQCLRGNAGGPENETPCPDWIYDDNSTCPGKLSSTLAIFYSLLTLLLAAAVVIPDCGQFVNCNTCAEQEACAWCASGNECLTIADSFKKDCRGVVYDLPCPASYVAGKPVTLYLQFVSFYLLFVTCR